MKKKKRQARKAQPKVRKTYAQGKRLTEEDIMGIIGKMLGKDKAASAPESSPSIEGQDDLIEEARHLLLETAELVKEFYKRMDAVTAKLINVDPEELAKSGLALVDNFAEKNVVWRPKAFKRFDLTLIKGHEKNIKVRS